MARLHFCGSSTCYLNVKKLLIIVSILLQSSLVGEMIKRGRGASFYHRSENEKKTLKVDWPLFAQPKLNKQLSQRQFYAARNYEIQKISKIKKNLFSL